MAQLQLRYYTFVKGGEVFKNAKVQESRVGKCTSQELFIVMCNVKNKLLNKVVKDKIRMSVPVIHVPVNRRLHFPSK